MSVTRAAAGRLGWLDALRGVAALVVVFDHSSYAFLAQTRQALTPYFSTSRYGIMVFFLVSGYIIPASLERGGCVRTFWISRVFRIYPMWAVAVASVLALRLLGVAAVRTDVAGQRPLTVALAHLTMLQELLGTPGVLLVLWTLSYEMAFYLLVVALFTVRLHRRSTTAAVTLAGFAAVAALAAASGRTEGGVAPSALAAAVGAGPLTVCVSVVLVIAVCGASAGSPVPRVAGGLLGGALALVLVACDGTVPLWEGLVILAVMFLGTAVYRADHGQSSRRRTAATAAVVVSCAVGSAYGYGDGTSATRLGWIVAFLLAVLTFGAGWAARRRRVWRGLTGLGAISYSLYLVHPVLLAVTDGTIGRWRRDNLVLEVAFLAALLPLCVLTRRCVEAPGRTLGRSLSRSPSPEPAAQVGSSYGKAPPSGACRVRRRRRRRGVRR
ncbi:acyltransferase [Streptomyces sp. NPDC005574]|uniref:acyltransferase family protein n=1 Tax=Streptomyces sp. NPDC005574 TaxID=3156891 RepID=UPI0033A98EFA